MKKLFSVAVILGYCAVASAEPNFARQYKGQYGYQPSCNGCHTDGGGSPLNSYGTAWQDAGQNTAAFAAIAEQDSDGDGGSNGAEALAKANPGDAESTIAKPSNWLDTSNLIPKEVQAEFVDVTTYLPRDATLTDAEIARAAGMGATLTADDENTIFIPLADRKPVGTAIIVPGEHDGQRFFLLLVTDPKLVLKTVKPVNAKDNPALAISGVYAEFSGVAVADLAKVDTVDSLDNAIRQAVKRGGTLLYVRLKKG